MSGTGHSLYKCYCVIINILLWNKILLNSDVFIQDVIPLVIVCRVTTILIQEQKEQVNQNIAWLVYIPLEIRFFIRT